MLSEEGAQNLFKNVHDLWIAPELKRRWPEGPPAEFKIRRCLVRLPVGVDPIVEFNEEVRWSAEVRVAEGVTAKEGEGIFLHQIESIRAVQPPEVTGKRVAFIFVYQTGRFWNVVFDASPNSPDIEPPASADQWGLGKHIAEFLQSSLVERAVNVPQETIEQLGQIGMWPAPALLPNPLARIVKSLHDGAPDEARAAVVQHCTTAFLEGLVNQWWGVPAFQSRRDLFVQSLHAHRVGHYALAIYTILPQVEGVITDWLYSKIPEVEVPFRQESKTKKFREVIGSAKDLSFTEKRIAETVIEFILNGPVLKAFERWPDAVELAFPGRHVVGHGRFDPGFITEENSIKVFLLMDTIWSLVHGI